MAVGYVQFALFRSCGKGYFPIALAGVGVVSQLSPPPLELLLEPLDEPPLEPAPELLLDPPLELVSPLLDPLPLPLEPLLPPVDDPPPLLLEPPPPSALEDMSPGFADVAQAARPRRPTRMQGSV